MVTAVSLNFADFIENFKALVLKFVCFVVEGTYNNGPSRVVYCCCFDIAEYA